MEHLGFWSCALQGVKWKLVLRCRYMSISLYDGREARFRLELFHHRQGNEDDLILATLDELGEVYEEDEWDEEFEDEERYVQAGSPEGAKHENI